MANDEYRADHEAAREVGLKARQDAMSECICGCDCDERAEVWVDTPDDFAGYSPRSEWQPVEVVVVDGE